MARPIKSKGLERIEFMGIPAFQGTVANWCNDFHSAKVDCPSLRATAFPLVQAACCSTRLS